MIYWDPNEEFKTTTKTIIDGFFANVAHDTGLASNVFGIAGQYTDTTGNAAYSSTFDGALADTQAYPKTGNCTVPNEADKGPYGKCLFDKQLQTELSRYIGEEKLPTGPTQLYFLLLPHSVATCIEGVVCSNNFFCAYHSYISPGTASEIIYADIPFSLLDAGFAKDCQDDGHPANLQQPNPDNEGGKNEETRFADVALKYISHEWIEAATDPLVNGVVAGKETTAWVDIEGLEIGDKCNGVSPDEEEDGVGYDAKAFTPTLGGTVVGDNLFNQSISTGSYYLQSEWDNANAACLMKPAALTAADFVGPASGTVGSPVGFTGSATDPYGKLGFLWSFGDGGSSTGASPSHSYAAPGVYTVTMTPKDALTDSTAAPVEHTITIGVGAAVPTVVTEAASSVGQSSATLNATVNPHGNIVSTCHFEYGTTLAYGSNAPCSSLPGGGEAPVAVSAKLTGLNPNTAYHYRIVATNTGGPAAGADHTFSTLPAVSEPVPPPSPTPTASQSTSSSASATASVVAALTSVLPPAPDSSFSLVKAGTSLTNGTITFQIAVTQPGTLSWLVAFQNGKFGVFAASPGKCKKGFVRLRRRCRPATIAFAKGSMVVGTAGSASFTVRPSVSAMKALRSALKRHRGLPVTAALTYQSSRGGSPVSHTRLVLVRLKKG